MRRLTVAAVGGRARGWAAEAERRYCERLSAWRATVVRVKAGAGPRALEQEAGRLLGKVPKGAAVVATQAGRGSESSRRFAGRMEGWMSGGGAAFIIGSADGLDAGLLDRADDVVSLSGLTLSHDLAMVVLLEQCYRAWTIITGHPYHRD